MPGLWIFEPPLSPHSWGAGGERPLLLFLPIALTPTLSVSEVHSPLRNVVQGEGGGALKESLGKVSLAP